ncbi:hypothetical protein CEP49_02220 [Mergibacter septicus]|uniref:curli polymerization inhibitor CsgI-related protein n=1 Tax=Mergibacter septicus TaxID=221402 RepID=UPI0011793078|nr:DUF2057 domain-containing protein [Mergibacter septicus]AWX13448.1 hypothetical protein CEP49_02220 [Mergibacter septicus]
MKLKSFALAIMLAGAAVSSFAANLSSSSNITFLAIDGKKPEKSVNKMHNVNLSDNQTHQVVVRVSEIVRNGSDRTLFESSPIIVTFETTNQDLTLSVPRIDTARDADKFSNNPKITLKNTNGQEISSKQEMLKQEGLFPDSHILEDLATYNTAKNKASVYGFATTVIPAIQQGLGKTTKGKVTVQGENVAEQMLQYWYQQADKQTQARFLKWANQLK